MQQITEYARQKAGNAVTTELQTNGAFSPKVREWILDNINIAWVSFDGTPDIQNSQRPFPNKKKSAPTIEENIKWLNANRKNRNLMIGARVTITDLNINRQIEMVDYFNSLGIKYIWTDPIFPEVKKKPVCEDEERKNEYLLDMDAYVRNFIEAHRYAKTIGVFYGSFLTCNFDGEAKTNCRACTPVPHLTTDGYVSACDMALDGEHSSHMNCFIYGKWDGQNKKFVYFEDKIQALRNRNIDNIAHCKTCPAKLHCGGHCLGEVVNTTGELNRQLPIICNAVRTLYKELGTCETYNYLHP
jgi:radical SAM protein with 4Fe4S-binding SPASM domain